MFNRIFSALALENGAKIELFFQDLLKASILWKLAKTIEKQMKFNDFLRLQPPQNDRKSMPKWRSKKASKKISQKSILAPVWASQSLQNKFKKRCKTKLSSRRYANCAEIVGS